ncbi:MAG: tRNA pseudouridine(55) synthase TruB [Candidatus Spechtbacterales bacterium]
MAVLLINKPEGITSHDVVDRVRRITGERRVGHAGTLDPFAQGLLIVLVGRDDTKRQAEFMGQEKEYVTTLRLGLETDSFDRTGAPTTLAYEGLPPTEDAVRAVLKRFVGPLEQIPPAFSAINIGGKRAYHFARKGEVPNLKARTITVRELELVGYAWPDLQLRMAVSSGTYVRALARDIGRALGTGAHVKNLTRTRIGGYRLAQAKTLEELVKM